MNNFSPFCNFLVNILADVIGGLGIALILLILTEKVFKRPDLNGRWLMIVRYDKTAHNPFKNMEVTFQVLLSQSGASISGTGEKIEAISLKGEEEYTGKDRIQLEDLSGHISKYHFFLKNQITLHYKEIGEKRPSSSLVILEKCGKDRYEGNFFSTIANSTGTAKLEKF